MKKVSLDTWIQLLGMLSVLAGLLFVGLEMRQTQRIALATNTNPATTLSMPSNCIQVSILTFFITGNQQPQQKSRVRLLLLVVCSLNYLLV